MPGALQGDPFVHQRAGIGAGDGGLGGAQVAQPAEAEQRSSPIPRTAASISNSGAAVADHDLAGEGEAAGIDFARARAVGGAQLLRRDQQPLGPERYERQAAAPDGR